MISRILDHSFMAQILLPFMSRRLIVACSSLVFAHGLNGDLIKTWTHPESQICWPQEWLPKELPKVRVMTYGYNADVAFGNSTADILDHAKGLLSSLVDERDNPNVTSSHNL